MHQIQSKNCLFFLLHAAEVPFFLQRRSRAERPTVSISWSAIGQTELKLFFLDNAALVITTVAVMKICYNSHQLITRADWSVVDKKAKKHKQPPQHPNQANKIWPICGETGETCVRSHYLVHSSKTPALTTSSAAHRMPYSNTWCHVANSNQPCTMCYQSTANTLTSRPGSMKVEQSCVPVWRALAYLIQIKQKWLTNLYPGIPTFISEWIQAEQSSPFQVQ